MGMQVIRDTSNQGCALVRSIPFHKYRPFASLRICSSAFPSSAVGYPPRLAEPQDAGGTWVEGPMNCSETHNYLNPWGCVSTLKIKMQAS